MIATASLVLAVFLLVQILIGLARVLRGPTPPDRMTAAQLFGTMGVAVLLLLGEATDEPALRDVALVFALLGALAALAFVSRVWRREDGRARHERGLPAATRDRLEQGPTAGDRTPPATTDATPAATEPRP